MIYRFIGVTLVIVSSAVFGHGGGLDKNGGHHDRKNGGYHCHREPCFSTQRNTDSALNEAVSENRQFSFVYRREDWKHWSDFDGDCMNTRHEILAAQSVGKVKLSPDGCYVSSGEWHDPYSGKTITRASDLDIDHVVPLKWVNDHGGGAWSSSEKEKFANDPLNLLAVDDNLNQEKGAKGPVEWMPPNHVYRCKYLMKWEEILKAYPSLKMTASDRRTTGKMIAACKQ